MTRGKSKSKQCDKRNTLVEGHQEFAERIVRRLISVLSLPPSAYEELLSHAYLGLVEAAQRYDSSSKVAFKNYSFLRIRGAVIDGIRRSGSISPKAYRLSQAWEAAQSMREDEPARTNSAQTPRERLETIIDFVARGAMVYRLSVTDAETEIQQSSAGQNGLEELLDLKLAGQKLRALVQRLPSRERSIVEQYYFAGKTFVEIAADHQPMTKSWVSRLHARAIDRLKRWYLENN